MSKKKKIQNLIKNFIRYIYKLIYGKIRFKKNDYHDSDINRVIIKIDKTINTIFKITNGRIYTDYVQHLAVIHKNTLINKACYQLKESSLISAKNNFVVLNGTPRIKKKINGNVLSLVNGASGNDNYFHWLFDILPRLIMLEKVNLLKNIDYFYLPEMKEFQIKSLKIFNINKNQFINSKKYRHITSKNIFATSHPWHRKGNILQEAKNIPNWIFNEISKRLILYKKKFDCNDRFFIDRRESKFNHCQIINNDEVKNFLIKKGFSIYSVGKLDLFNQFYLFNTAKKIIGPHGAAFANLIFCKKNTNVIEFFPNKHPNLVNKKISKIRNLRYLSLRSPEVNDKKNGDIYIDLKKLDKLINSQ